MKSTKLGLLGICLILAGLISACGGGGASATALPTLTQIPFYANPTATEAPQVATAAATLASAGTTGNADAIAKGLGRYEALCKDCHGDAGVGTDKGSAVNALAMSEAEFVSFMRSGGTVGKDHQFATNKLSETGGKNLYQYLLSLKGG